MSNCRDHLHFVLGVPTVVFGVFSTLAQAGHGDGFRSYRSGDGLGPIGEFRAAVGAVEADRPSSDAPIHLTQTTQTLRAQGSVVPMRVEPEMREKTFLAVGEDPYRWADSFCAAVLPLEGEDYGRFVRLLREESTSIEMYFDDSARSRTSRQPWERYTRSDTRLRVIECLEHGGEKAPPETQFDLYLVIEAFRQGPTTNPIKWLRRAAEGSHALARYLLAERILNSPSDPNVRAVIPSRQEEQVRLFRDYVQYAAESGLPQAQYLLGALSLAGSQWVSEVVDPAKAIEWLKRAARQSKQLQIRYSSAQVLGNAYFEGKVVPKDYEEALRWYTVIPKQDAVGLYAPFGGVGTRVREIYCKGLGVQRDPMKGQSYSAANVPCP